MRKKIIEKPKKKVRPFKTPSVLDDTLIDNIAKLIRQGNPIDLVCDYIGIYQWMFEVWQRRGMLYEKGGGEPKEDILYGRLVRKVRRAMAIYRKRRYNKLHVGRDPKNRMLEFRILERRDPANMGKRAGLNVLNSQSFDAQDQYL